MAKKDLLAEAASLGLDVDETNTVAEIEAALDAARGGTKEESPAPAPASSSRDRARRRTNLVYNR